MILEDQITMNEFQGLPAGWDCCGGRPTTPAAAKSLMEFLEFKELQARKADRIFPHPSGGVILAWERDGVQLLVNFQPDGAFAAMGVSSGKKHLWLGKAGREEFLEFLRYCVWPVPVTG